MLKESIRMSWQNILGNKLRSFLTTLGIIIGVTAIISLVTTMEGASNEITSQFTELGAGRVSISVSGTPLKHGLTEKDIALIRNVENVAGIDPSITTMQHVAGAGTLIEDVSIEGRSDCYFSSTPGIIGTGRGLLPLDMDPHSRVCVIDEEVRSALFPNSDPLGETVVFNGLNFKIVGVLSDDTGNDVMSVMSAMTANSNGTIIIPYEAAMRLNASGTIDSLTVYLNDTDFSDATIDDIESVLNAAFNYRDNAFRIISIDSLLDTMDAISDMMTTLIAGIASIALLVGGIGIMNMMLVSVTERTMEIGLRKALGAKPRLIQMQFLIESVMLSMIGGILGIIVGNLLSYGIAVLIDYTFVISTGATSLAFIFSATVGILFGWMPARKASQLNPIDALRSM